MIKHCLIDTHVQWYIQMFKMCLFKVDRKYDKGYYKKYGHIACSVPLIHRHCNKNLPLQTPVSHHLWGAMVKKKIKFYHIFAELLKFIITSNV
jgi:hypothetical protein